MELVRNIVIVGFYIIMFIVGQKIWRSLVQHWKEQKQIRIDLNLYELGE